MFEWITAHLATVLTGLVVLGILAAVAVQMVRDHKKCNGSCGCCPNAAGCRRDGGETP